MFKEYIFINLNIICTLDTCSNPEDDIITNFLYEINEVLFILSFNTNINEYTILLKKKDFINKIFKSNISIFHKKYELFRFVTMPHQNHFVSYFKCLNKKYPNSLNYWFKFDDIEGKYSKINNFDLSINNVRETESICLLIYFKNE